METYDELIDERYDLAMSRIRETQREEAFGEPLCRSSESVRIFW